MRRIDMVGNPLRRSLVAALLLALATLAAPQALADSTRLDVSVTTSPTEVTISGTLLADGKALKRREVTAQIDGAAAGRAQTRGNGTFTIAAELGTALAPGTHSASVRFEGGDGDSPATAMVNFQIAGAAGNEPDAPAVEPVKPPVAPDLKLRVTGPEDAINSEVVELSGRLLDAAGKGVGGAGISLHDAAGEVGDAYTVSDSKGAFSTWYTVPDDQPEGVLKLSLLAQGAGTARATLTIAITRTELEPTPTATPTPTPTATASATLTPTPAPSPVPSDSPSAKPSGGISIDVDTRTGPISALFGATLGVAVLVTVCLGALAARLHRRRALPNPDGRLEFFTEDEATPPPGAPRRGLPAD